MKAHLTDFHAHILPGLDHGSDSLQTSLKQLEMAAQIGIDTIVATSHFYPDRHNAGRFIEQRAEALSELLAAAPAQAPKIIPAAEVLLCEGMHNLPELDKLTIGNSKLILIEMPDPPWSNRVIEALELIEVKRGLRPILAHVDRYPVKAIKLLFAKGGKGQINAGALCSLFKRRELINWCAQGRIVALGSDIHLLSDAYGYYKKSMHILGKHGDKLQAQMRELLADS